jgi:hypothetical protein
LTVAGMIRAATISAVAEYAAVRSEFGVRHT